VAAWHHHDKPKRTRPGLDADIYLLRLDSFGFAIRAIPKVQADTDLERERRASPPRARASVFSRTP
jgi:hypothetical protein